MTTPTPPTPSKLQTLAGPLMMIGGAIAVGYAPIGLRLSEFEPQATAFWRFVLALPVLFIITIIIEKRIHRPSIFSLLTGLFFALDIAFWHAALVRASVANATFIVNLGAVGVGVMAWIFLKERPSRLWPMAAIVSVIGAYLLSRGASDGGSGNINGDLIACIAATMLTFYFFFGKLARRKDQPFNILFWATVVQCLVALIASTITSESINPIPPTTLIIPATLAIVAHVAGQGLIIAGLGRTSAAFAGLLMLFQPITAALVAATLFSENLGTLQLFGAAMILVGVWLAGKR